MAISAPLIVYPAKDLDKAKALFSSLLGVDPYADAAYYVGFRTENGEIGLDPQATSAGPIAYWETDDIAAKIDELNSAGWQTTSEARNVGGGMLVAQLSDGSGNTIGLRQPPN